MKRFKESHIHSEFPREHHGRLASVEALSAELETNGVVVLPSIISPDQLRDMQAAFDAKLRRVRWNNFDGYQRTEIYRHMVEDVLLLAQSFVDLAVHPLVKEILSRYLGPQYQLTEAKGWKSLPTSYDFHGWHGDMWYERKEDTPIHREIKLAMYLKKINALWDSGTSDTIRRRSCALTSRHCFIAFTPLRWVRRCGFRIFASDSARVFGE